MGRTRRRGDDRIANYSSRGPTWFDGEAKPDVAAPGHNLLSVAARSSVLGRLYADSGGRGRYMRLSGTSVATGVASGIVALALSANPDLTPNAVKAMLQYSAFPARDRFGVEYNPLADDLGPLANYRAIRETLHRPALSFGTSSDRIGFT